MLFAIVGPSKFPTVGIRALLSYFLMNGLII